MPCPFWEEYTDTAEFCDAVAAAAPVSIAWPEFPWATEGLTEGAQPSYNDAYDEAVAANFPSATRSGLIATGSTQTTIPALTAGSPIEMLSTLDTTVAAMPSLTTPTAGEIASWGPDTVDFFVQVTGTVNTVAVGASGFRTQVFGDPVTMTVTDQGAGLWRIRLENLSDLDINGASNGDGIIEDNGGFADVANSVGTFFQGLTASQRYYSRTVDFDIGGTSTIVSVGFMVRFDFP